MSPSQAIHQKLLKTISGAQLQNRLYFLENPIKKALRGVPQVLDMTGGADRDRTDDLMNAIHRVFQNNYPLTY